MKPWTDGTPGQWAWLCHHGVLLEPLIEPSLNRVEYIEKKKPSHEVQIRLEWFRPVLHPERLPEAVAKASAACAKARAAYDKVFRDHWDEIAALHKEEYPGCPFDYESKTLMFPQEVRDA